MYVDYYHEHAAEQKDLSGDLSAAWSKLEEIAARLALVLHCVKLAMAPPHLAWWLRNPPLASPWPSGSRSRAIGGAEGPYQ